MIGSVLYLFELKLRVLFNFTLSCINKSSRVTKILSKKNLELNPGWKSYTTPMFVLMLIKIDLFTKKKGDK